MKSFIRKVENRILLVPEVHVIEGASTDFNYFHDVNKIISTFYLRLFLVRISNLLLKGRSEIDDFNDSRDILPVNEGFIHIF